MTDPKVAALDTMADALSSVMQDHILDKQEGWPHRRGGLVGPSEDRDGCDDICSDDLARRLTAAGWTLEREGLREALDVERLADAMMEALTPGWRGDKPFTKMYAGQAKRIAAAYDAEGAIPTPGSGGQQVGASGSGQPTPATPEVGE